MSERAGERAGRRDPRLGRPRIAFLIDHLCGDYQVEARAAIERAAEIRGVDLLVVAGRTLEVPDSGDAVQNVLFDFVGPAMVDGVVVLSSTVGHFVGTTGLRLFFMRFVPLALCSVGHAIAGVPSIIIDNARGMEAMVAHVLDVHGARRIAYISGPAHSSEGLERTRGFRRALAKRAIPFDDDLMATGDFSIPSGASAMHQILARDATVDAVIAANDNMAFGAVTVLRGLGIAVPGQVKVCGFDDASVARFTNPSLTTVRQPMKHIAMTAIDTVLGQMEGFEVPPCTTECVELVSRESCGCGYNVTRETMPWSVSTVDPAGAESERRETLEDRLTGLLALPPESLGGWPGRLLTALALDLDGSDGKFLCELEGLLDAGYREGASVDDFQRVISLLRAETRLGLGGSSRPPETTLKLERLWHAARVLIGSSATRDQGTQRLQMESALNLLGRSGERFATSLNRPLLRRALAEKLPAIGIQTAIISLFEGSSTKMLKAFFVMRDGAEIDPPKEPFPASLLVPPEILGSTRRSTRIVLLLTFETETLGVVVFEGTAQPPVYETLRQQIGGALKSGAMHEAIIHAMSVREHVERDRREEEARVAARIQSAIVPKTTSLEGLEISATMITASDVGGDYYDVIPGGSGGFIGIGDVAGHGLAAGLVVLMIQSMITALVRRDPKASPAEVLRVLNQGLHENVLHRLERAEYATLALLRYERGGSITFAGAHESILVCRARDGACEFIETTGVWVAALPDIASQTHDNHFRLEDGDVMVLFTDGVTEALNTRSEQFGLERLSHFLKLNRLLTAEGIRDVIVGAVREWCTTLDDDVTVLVARYSAAT